MVAIGKVINLFVKRDDKLCRSLLTLKPPNVTNFKNLKYSSLKVSTLPKSVKVHNLKTGTKEVIDIENAIVPKTGEYVDISAFNANGDTIGLVRLKDAPNNEMYRTLGQPEKESLYIDFWATSPNYKGVGKEMLKKIVQISNQSGYCGRVSLMACTGSVPSKFMRICGYQKAQDVACAIKYKKMGFKANMPEIDEKIQESIAKGDSGFVTQVSAFGKGKRDTLSTSMYLSDETIKKYLGLAYNG